METIKNLLLLVWAVSAIDAYNILVVAPLPFIGHWIYFEEFIRDILARGHEVTAITSYNIRQLHPSYTGIVIPAFGIQKHCESIDI